VIESGWEVDLGGIRHQSEPKRISSACFYTVGEVGLLCSFRFGKIAGLQVPCLRTPEHCIDCEHRDDNSNEDATVCNQASRTDSSTLCIGGSSEDAMRSCFRQITC
jgi:hypothetical protein